MYHALAQDKSVWRALLSSRVGFILVVTFLCVSLSHSFAQSQAVDDVTPPTLTAFSFTPTTIDTSAGQVDVTVSVSATDDLAGVLQVWVVLESPSGMQARIAQTGPITPPPTDLSVTANALFPQFSEAGIWTVAFVHVADAVDNNRRYSTAELGQLGFPTELVVTEAVDDVTPPLITVSATPTALWPPNGKMVPVTISGTIKDAESGVNASTTAYAVIDEYGLIQPSGHSTILDATNGSYAFTIRLQASRHGKDKDGRQYTIIVSAQDNEGNQGSKSTVVTVP
jgi:hypothetical protein